MEMEPGLKLSQLKKKELKRLHTLQNRSWVSQYDLEKTLSEDGQPTDSGSVSALADQAGLVEFSEGKYTTPEIHQAERVAVASSLARKGESAHHLKPETLNQVLSANSTLREEQANAIRYAASESGGVAPIIGAAGVGKSYTMNVARQAFEADDFDVVGISPSGAAAIELEKSSGIHSKTAFRFYSDVMQGKQVITNKSVIVYDEAGMADSLSLGRVINIAHEKGAKVILVGDPNQFESVGTASLFDRICEDLNAAEMIQIARQHDERKQEVSKDFYNQNGAEAVEKMSQLGMIHQSKPEDTKAKLVNDYLNYRSDEKSVLALASTNKDVADLNDRIVSGLIERGELNPDESVATEITSSTGAQEELTLYKGEEVMFRMSDSKSGIVNGDVAKIKEFTDDGFIAQVDRGEESFEAEINLNSYNHIQPAYAMTVHKSQGATVDKSFIAPDTRYLDSRAMYVASTRGRDGVEVYIPEGSLEQLKQASDRTITKSSTLDEYSEVESDEFDRYVDSIQSTGESLLDEPENRAHHFDELNASGEYARLKREASMPEVKTLRDLAIKAGGRTESAGAGFTKRQAEKFQIGGKTEARTQAFLNSIREDIAPIEEVGDYRDERNLSEIRDAQRETRLLPEIETDSGKQDSKGIEDESAIAFHKESIIERAKAAQEYQSQVNAIYNSVGFTNSNSRSNAQASYAGEQLRGEASLLTQNTRDYMLALQEAKFSKSGKAQLGRAAFGLDKTWMAMHQKAERFRDAQEERLERGTVESILEYKHAQAMDNWSKKIAQGQGGTLSEQRDSWKAIEDTIARDRQALNDLIKSNGTQQDAAGFAQKTGVYIGSEGQVMLGAHMSPEERRAIKQQERDELLRTPHAATIEYQRDPDAYLKKLAEEQSQKDATQDQDNQLESKDLNKSEKDQVGVSSDMRAEIDRREQEVAQRESEEQALKDELEREQQEEDQRQEMLDAEEQERVAESNLEEHEAEQRRREDEAEKAESDRQDEIERQRQEDMDRERDGLAEQERQDREREDQESAERQSQEDQERIEQQEREELERDQQEDRERSEQEEAERQQQESLEEEERSRQEEFDQEQEDQLAREDQEREQEEIDQLKDEISNPEAQAQKQEEDRQAQLEDERRISEELDAQEEREALSKEDAERDQQIISDELDRQEAEEREEQARSQSEEERQSVEDQMERSEIEEIEQDPVNEADLTAEQQAAYEEDLAENQRLEQELANEQDREQEHLTEQDFEKVDRAIEAQEAEKESSEMTPEQAEQYQAQLDQKAEEQHQHNKDQDLSQESPEDQDVEREQLEQEMSEERRREQEEEMERRRQEQEQEEDDGLDR